MNNQYTVVFSAWRTSNDLIANIEASKAARLSLDALGLPHWDAVGSYLECDAGEHKQEVSHIVHCKSAQDVELIKDIAWQYNQDCVMIVEQDNTAYLAFNHGDTMEIGVLTTVSKEVAHDNDCYTYFLGEYYVCS